MHFLLHVVSTPVSIKIYFRVALKYIRQETIHYLFSEGEKKYKHVCIVTRIDLVYLSRDRPKQWSQCRLGQVKRCFTTVGVLDITIM